MNIQEEALFLVDALKDSDWHIRDQSLKKLFNIRNPEIIKPLAEEFRNVSAILRFYFCRFLGIFRHPDGIPYLIEFLNDESPQVRGEAGLALDKIGHDEKYKYLLDILTHGKDFGQQYAVKALGKAGKENAVIPLIKMLSHVDSEMRISVIDALRQIRDLRAAGAVRLLLEDPVPSVRHTALFALADMGAANYSHAIAKRLDDENPYVRKTAVWALRILKCFKMVPRLMTMFLEEKVPSVRYEILRFFITIQEEDVHKALSICQDDHDPNIRRLIRSATNRFSDRQVEYPDVCIIVEGTYPYVQGGVASWIHQLIQGLSDLRFAILYIGALEKDMRELKYDLPSNVVDVRELYLYEAVSQNRRREGFRKKGAAGADWIKAFDKDGRYKSPEDLFAFLINIPPDDLDAQDIFFSQKMWTVLLKIYQEVMPDTSFLDYFWTWRSMMIPLFHVLKAQFPKAGVYHAVSTGYAGLIGSLAKRRYGAPYLLTEHGIYHWERKMEIDKATWIGGQQEEMDIRSQAETGMLKKMWMGMFDMLSKIAYNHADKIVAFFRDNSKIQIEMGAKEEKTMIIPNGINPGKFLVSAPPKDKNIFRVGLIGRVVPIKDIKTFIRTAKIVSDKIPRSEFLVMGPIDEDPDYFRECMNLTRFLGMEDQLKFTDTINVFKYYPTLDVLVFTSISEAQPLTMLEGMYAGVPIAATNVGACGELLNGREGEDKKMGPCGIITRVGTPSDTAEAILKIFMDKGLRERMISVGKKRVEQYYQQSDVIQRYGKLYSDMIKR